MPPIAAGGFARSRSADSASELGVRAGRSATRGAPLPSELPLYDEVLQRLAKYAQEDREVQIARKPRAPIPPDLDAEEILFTQRLYSMLGAQLHQLSPRQHQEIQGMYRKLKQELEDKK